MTGRLYVSLECGYTGDTEEGVVTHLVGNIFATTPDNVSLRHISIPVGWAAPPAVFELQAGRYVVEAGLPSGQILSEDVDIVNNEATRVEFDLRGSSPFESHMLQYMLGNIEPSAVYHGPDGYPLPNSHGSRSFPRPDAARYESTVDQSPGARVFVLPRVEDGPPGIAALNELRQQRPAAASQSLGMLLRSPSAPVELQPQYAQPLSPIFRLNARTDAEVGHSPGFSHLYQYLRVTASGAAYMVTVPWLWRDETGLVRPVELLLNLRQAPTGSPVSVAVRDPDLGGGLGYFASGFLDKAAVLFGNLESIVYGKVNNPLAAAAGGYVLVGTETSDRSMRWDPWLSNLRNWFPELSDGSILWGTRRLRTSRTEAEVDEARTALLEGYSRGLPVFTLGLTWMIDGLSAFPSDPECATALQQVRQLCWQVDMSEPFVVLRLGSGR
jgi:hypothetical protein